MEALTGLLDTPDDRLRRLAAKDAVEIHAKQVEMEALQARLSAIEEKLRLQSSPQPGSIGPVCD